MALHPRSTGRLWGQQERGQCCGKRAVQAGPSGAVLTGQLCSEKVETVTHREAHGNCTVCAARAVLCRGRAAGVGPWWRPCHTGEVAQSRAGAGQDLVGCAVLGGFAEAGGRCDGSGWAVQQGRVQ